MALNKQEIDAIGLDTMKVPGETDKWFVTIEMFHQLVSSLPLTFARWQGDVKF